MTASVPRDQIVDADDNVIVDNVLIDYDYEKYNFGDWIRSRMHEAGYDVTDLTKIHEVIPYDELQNFQIKLIRETARPDFKEILHPFVHEVLEPVFGAEIATQRFSNIRLFLPNRSEMKIAYHTGVWYGHWRRQFFQITAGTADEDAIPHQHRHRLIAAARARHGRCVFEVRQHVGGPAGNADRTVADPGGVFTARFSGEVVVEGYRPEKIGHGNAEVFRDRSDDLFRKVTVSIVKILQHGEQRRRRVAVLGQNGFVGQGHFGSGAP